VVLGVLSWLVLFETHTERGGAGFRGNPFMDGIRLMSNVRFASYVLQSGFSTGAFFTLASASAFMLTGYLGRPPSEYGAYFMFYPIGFLLGNFLSSRLSGRIRTEAMVFTGSFILLLTAATQSTLIALDHVTPLTIFLPGFFVTCAQGLALPNSQSGAIIEAGPLAGTGAGIGAFMQLFAAAFFTQLYGFAADGTPVPMAVVISVCAVLSCSMGTVTLLMRRRD